MSKHTSTGDNMASYATKKANAERLAREKATADAERKQRERAVALAIKPLGSQTLGGDDARS